jgi:hypothetical protein
MIVISCHVHVFHQEIHLLNPCINACWRNDDPNTCCATIPRLISEQCVDFTRAWVDSVDGPVKTCETNMKTLIETHLSKWLVYHGYITIYLQHICLDGNQVTRC